MCVCVDYGQPVIVIPWVVLQELDHFKRPKKVRNHREVSEEIKCYLEA